MSYSMSEYPLNSPILDPLFLDFWNGTEGKDALFSFFFEFFLILIKNSKKKENFVYIIDQKAN